MKKKRNKSIKFDFQEVIDAVLAVQRVYGGDSNGLHQKLYAAVAIWRSRNAVSTSVAGSAGSLKSPISEPAASIATTVEQTTQLICQLINRNARITEFASKVAGTVWSDREPERLLRELAKEANELLPSQASVIEESRAEVELEKCPKCGTGYAPSLTHLCPRDVAITDTQALMERQRFCRKYRKFEDKDAWCPDENRTALAKLIGMPEESLSVEMVRSYEFGLSTRPDYKAALRRLLDSQVVLDSPLAPYSEAVSDARDLFDEETQHDNKGGQNG